SPEAQKLAAYLAAVPLTLPVMRVVHRVMFPKPRLVHLAEVFLSGLIKMKTSSVYPDNIQYDFAEGVRDILISSSRVSETVEVITRVTREVSGFVDRNTGKPLDFQAIIADPSIIDQVLVAEQTKPFATVATSVLSRLGGRYLQLAKRFEQRVADIDHAYREQNKTDTPEKVVSKDKVSVKTKQRKIYDLRKDSIKVSREDAEKIFRLKKVKYEYGDFDVSRPVEYINNDYEDNGDDTVTDYATGLMWQKSGSDKQLQYKYAEVYIDELNRKQFAGHDDWRLPTIDELLSLMEPEKKSNDLFIDPIFDKKQWWCWSSDRVKESGKKSKSSSVAWVVGFSIGNVYLNDLSSNDYVRGVCPRQ
ncbi:MAG: DUF1566 domain-containing protein, partial [Desulfobacteraceae bacterium]|nr:DUF1566 domain-containing protein [Desulfobacteraceae bacterium]